MQPFNNPEFVSYQYLVFKTRYLKPPTALPGEIVKEFSLIKKGNIYTASPGLTYW
jgi:hypothetical protein